MYCKYCGEPIADDSVFCNKCGKQQFSPKHTSKKTAQTKAFPIKRVFKWILITLVIIIISLLITPIPVLAAWLIYNKWYCSRDHIKYKKEDMKENADIIDITHSTCGNKFDHKIRTTITFDDGFCYISHDTCVETSRFLNVYTQKLTLTQKMEDEITEKAINKHYEILGIKRPPRPQYTKCGKCDYTGWYVGNCPNCGSSMKTFPNSNGGWGISS